MTFQFGGIEKSPDRNKFAAGSPQHDSHTACFSFRYFLAHHKDHGSACVKKSTQFSNFIVRLKEMGAKKWGEMKRDRDGGVRLKPIELHQVKLFKELPDEARKDEPGSSVPYEFGVGGNFRVFGFFGLREGLFEVVYLDPDHRTFPHGAKH